MIWLKDKILIQKNMDLCYYDCIKFKNDIFNFLIAKKSFKFSLIKYMKYILNTFILKNKYIVTNNLTIKSYVYNTAKNELSNEKYKICTFRITPKKNILYILGYIVYEFNIISSDNITYSYRFTNNKFNQNIMFSDFTKSLEDILIEYKYYTNSFYNKFFKIDNNKLEIDNELFDINIRK